MTTAKQSGTTTKSQKEKRLNEALRANLKRRKAPASNPKPEKPREQPPR